MEKAFTRDFGALDDVFGFVGEFVEREKISEAVAFSLNLAVEELFTNMVKYNSGGGEGIRIALRKEGRTVCLQLVDTDVDPFDPASAPEVAVDRPLDERTPGGLGLHLVRSVVDKITFEYNDREMKVTVVKNLEPTHV
jgi:serine/threonine-protein kinase RsbW